MTHHSLNVSHVYSNTTMIHTHMHVQSHVHNTGEGMRTHPSQSHPSPTKAFSPRPKRPRGTSATSPLSILKHLSAFSVRPFASLASVKLHVRVRLIKLHARVRLIKLHARVRLMKLHVRVRLIKLHARVRLMKLHAHVGLRMWVSVCWSFTVCLCRALTAQTQLAC
jgi:hypothetical protein